MSFSHKNNFQNQQDVENLFVLWYINLCYSSNSDEFWQSK